jgi:hypothetical protein
VHNRNDWRAVVANVEAEEEEEEATVNHLREKVNRPPRKANRPPDVGAVGQKVQTWRWTATARKVKKMKIKKVKKVQREVDHGTELVENVLVLKAHPEKCPPTVYCPQVLLVLLLMMQEIWNTLVNF